MKVKQVLLLISVFFSCYTKFETSGLWHNKLIYFPEKDNNSLYSKEEIRKIISSRTLYFYIKEPYFIDSPGREIYRGFSIKATARLNDDCFIDVLAQVKSNDFNDTTAFFRKLKRNQRLFERDDYIKIEVILTSPDFEDFVKSSTWDIYIKDGQQNSVEPAKIEDEENILKQQRKVRYLGINPQIYNQNIYRNMFVVFFRKKDFYGVELLDKKRKYISLVFSYKKDVKGECTWKFLDR